MKRLVILIIVFSLNVLPAPIANAATTLSNTATSNPIFVEDGNEVLIGEGITFTNETSFSGGSLLFAVGSSAATDILNLQKVSTAITTLGVVSVVGSTIYKGDGTNANPVASIDATLDGSAGKNLKINFSSAFTNASFETGDFTGWEYIAGRIDIGVTTLAGVVSSDLDNLYPNTCSGQSLNDNDEPASATYSHQFATGKFPNPYASFDSFTDGSRSLRLFSTMTTLNGGDIVHGPAVVSSEFTAAINDVISFDWAAVAGGDDFDAYGYLINSATGAQIELIDANGTRSGTAPDSPWVTKSTIIPVTGNYRFVFINGTHDLSCGTVAGGSLYLDNIRVAGTSATAALAESIARLVTYKSTSNNPAVTRTVTFTPTPASGSITALTITVDVTAVDDGPVPSNIAISYTDTSANDDFSASTGTISANDPDGGSGGASTTFGITGGTSASGSTTRVGTFGTLTVNESTGAYSYEPNDSAINTVIVNTSEAFTITATSGALIGSATVTISITGAGESSVSVPTISGISPDRGPIAGGTVVTVTGSGFSSAQFVKFGVTDGTNLTILSNTSLTIEAPAKLAGTYNLTVINTGGTNSGTNNYVYYIPAAPSAPTSVSAISGNVSATVSWTASVDATSYIVTSNPGGFTCTTATTTCAVTGLTNGTAYTFTVVARNATGNSSPSSASTAVTPSLPLPSTPTGVTATAGDESAQVSWSASANSATYLVTSIPGGFTCTTASTLCTINGLTNGTSYTFTVIGRNATGDSTASSASTSITPAATIPSVTSILPATGSTAGGTSVTITGVRFTGATSVTFGGNAGTSLTVVSDTTITITTPAGSAGVVTVIVTTSSGPDIDGITFTYVEPTQATPRRIIPTQEQITAQNQALANRITISAPTNSNNVITGPVKINGVSENSRIFVDPLVIPKLPGFSNIKVNQNSIEVIPVEKFSGNMTVPVTVSENGATVTINISVVVNPKPVVQAQTSPITSKLTGVAWEPSPNALSYKVQLNGQPLCTSSTTSCTIPKLLGPNSKLEVISLGNDKTISTQVIPAYVPSKPIPVLDVKFSLGSSMISKKEVRKLDSFVELMKAQGFTNVSIDAFTDGVGGTKGAQALAQARARQVADYLNNYLSVSISSSGKGISPIAKGSKKPLAAARKAQVSVS